MLICLGEVVLVLKNPPANAGDIRDLSSIPGSGRSPEEGSGIPLQYSCLENPMNRGAWGPTVHRVTKSRAQLSNFTLQSSSHEMLGCMNHKLESRLPGEISTTSDIQMIPL